MSEMLRSWNEGPAKRAIVAFVEQAVSDVPVEERLAVFDNDGTLWCEKPMQGRLGRRLATQVVDGSSGSDDPA